VIPFRVASEYDRMKSYKKKGEDVGYDPENARVFESGFELGAGSHTRRSEAYMIMRRTTRSH